MIKKHANLRFKQYRQAELAPLANYIADTMSRNADVFPAPAPSLAEVKKLIDAYSAVLGKSDYAGQTGDIHETRHALEAALKTLGEYVNHVADGDEAKLEKSGFPLSKDHAKYGPLPALKYAHFKNGESSGKVAFELEALDGCFGYIIAVKLASNPEPDYKKWDTYWRSKHIGELSGFERGKEYKFAVVAVGASDELNWYEAGNTLFAN